MGEFEGVERRDGNPRRNEDDCDREHNDLMLKLEKKFTRMIIVGVIMVVGGFIYIANAQVRQMVPEMIGSTMSNHQLISHEQLKQDIASHGNEMHEVKKDLTKQIERLDRNVEGLRTQQGRMIELLIDIEESVSDNR